MPATPEGGPGAVHSAGRGVSRANLAKLGTEPIFNAVADAVPDIRKAGPPERLRSGWINAIKHLPVSYRGAPTVA